MHGAVSAVLELEVARNFLLPRGDEDRTLFLRAERHAQALSEEPHLGHAILAHHLEQLQAALAQLDAVADLAPRTCLDAREHLDGATEVAIRRHEQPAQRMV